MDGQRFDDLARLLASPTDRRVAIKRLVGSLLGLGGAIALKPQQVAVAAPAPEVLIESPPAAPVLAKRLPHRQHPRTVAGPQTRPVIKGRTQLESAGTPVMTLTPTSGKIKSAISAKLTGFRSNESISLLWFDGSVSKTVATGMTSSGGKATISFFAPYAYRGYHTIRAVGSRGSRADARFAIVPSFTLKPKKGPRGTTVKASLSGYAKNAVVEIRFFPTADASGTPVLVRRVTLSATGTGSTQFAIRQSFAMGLHRIEGREQTTGRLASAKFIVQCQDAGQCPGQDTECASRICTNGICGMEYVPHGSQIANQTFGDCKANVCDGAGNAIVINDDSDVTSDANDCTEDYCQDGVLHHAAKPEGTACGIGGENICNDTGVCVGCLTVDSCPGIDTECSTRTCVDSICGRDYVPSGTPIADQTSGDCKSNVCDGNGSIVSVNDDFDVLDDGNQCSTDICVDGVPSNAPVTNGQACSQNGGSVCVDGDCLVCTPNATQS